MHRAVSLRRRPAGVATVFLECLNHLSQKTSVSDTMDDVTHLRQPFLALSPEQNTKGPAVTPQTQRVRGQTLPAIALQKLRTPNAVTYSRTGNKKNLGRTGHRHRKPRGVYTHTFGHSSQAGRKELRHSGVTAGMLSREPG